MVKDAKQNLGTEITDVVITCPAYFGINEREATRTAGEIAGLNVRSIINEPTAAAIAYGIAETEENQTVLVYDLGGGTFDVTMIEIKPESIEVICTGGDHSLGGKDWDDQVVQYMVNEFQEKTGTTEDILEDPVTFQDLLLQAEKVKKTLSQREKAGIVVNHGRREKFELTREKFNEITEPLLNRTIAQTREMLEEAENKGYSSYDKILLVGGSTRMPCVEERVGKEFRVEVQVFDPDEAVAKGAATFGWKLSVNDLLVQRVAETTGKSVEDVKSSPDQAVQDVAEKTGLTLSGVKRSQIEIRNVTSKSFGVVAKTPSGEEIVRNLITKNTTVPAENVQEFGTEEANQETVDIHIMENEQSELQVPVDQAKEIGTAVLNLPEGLSARSPVRVTFGLNEEGRLEVSAVELSESRKVDVTIETRSAIQGEELEQAKARSKSLVVS